MSCPIINTHRRLNEVHRLWHQCLENYFDPEGFRTNLNATIQALRNLTFALQNEKSEIQGFENWYFDWQQLMKEDEVLSWLNDARVKIVHQKDLETQSFVKVTVKNYLEVAEFELELPPLTPTELIGSECVKLLSQKYHRERVKECYAVIERKWVEKELDEWELLDALSYGYNFLYKMVVEAHEKAGSNFTDCSSIDKLHELEVEELRNGQFDCMRKQTEFRKETVTLTDFKNVEHEFRKVSFDEKSIKKAVRRYKPKKLSDEGKQIIDYAREINEIAKKVLKKDKYHTNMFMMRLPSKDWRVIQADVKDQTSKFLLMSRIAKLVEEEDGNAIIHISEVWTTNDLNAVKEGKKVVETEDKREALLVTLVVNDGTQRSFYTPFRKSITRSIILEETEESDSGGINFFSPIIKIWEKKNAK